MRGATKRAEKAGAGAVATAAGKDAKDVRQALKAGKSLAQFGADNGLSRDQVKSAYRSAVEAQLDKLVAEGKLTADRKARVLDRLDKNLDKIVDYTHQKKQ